jgi:hypothetical protein
MFISDNETAVDLLKLRARSCEINSETESPIWIEVILHSGKYNDASVED